MLGGDANPVSPSSAPAGDVRWTFEAVARRISWTIFVACVGFHVTALVYRLSRLSFFALIRVLYNGDTLWLPAILLGVAAVALILRRREALRGAARRHILAWLACGLLLASVRVYATHIEPRLLQVRRVTLRSAKLDRPLRILHISDIQTDRVGRYEERCFRIMRELKPDLVIHSGDLVQALSPATFASEWPRLRALFATLTPPLGIHTVYGDTDQPVRGLSADQFGNVRVLRSEAVSSEWGGRQIRILGLSRRESGNSAVGLSRVSHWLEDGDANDFRVVVGHAPDYILRVSDLPVDLCLAGHTHGGQIRIPWFGPILTLSRVPRDWARGFREVGRTRLNVSAGIGCEHAGGLPCIRLNCPPELTLIEILPEHAPER